MRTLAVMLFAAAAVLPAQQLDLSSLDKLAAKAKEKAVVTLAGNQIRAFLDQEDDAETRKLLTGMKGVYVRSFEFEKPGEYDQADFEAVRRQLRGPGWTNIVDVQSKDESAAVYMHETGGLAVIAAEPKEVTVVNIVGRIDLSSIGEVGKHFGITGIGGSERKKPNPSPKPKPAPAPQAKD